MHICLYILGNITAFLCDVGLICNSHRHRVQFHMYFRSPWAIPGLWLLSLSLSGVRQRNQGSLSLPIGLRAGIMASSFILQKGGFLTNKPNIPLWITGTHPFQPFSGISGFAFSLLLALFLYPRQPLQTNNLKGKNGE